MSKTYKAKSIQITDTIGRFEANEIELLKYIKELEAELEEYKKLYSEAASKLNDANHKLSEIEKLSKRQNFCELHNVNYALSGYCVVCYPNGL